MACKEKSICHRGGVLTMDIGKISNADTNVSASIAKLGSLQRPSHAAVLSNDNPKDSRQGDENIGLNDLTKSLNEQMSSLNANVKFEFNDEIGELYISVVEKDTGALIRQIPTEEAMKLKEHLKNIVGMLFDKEG